MFAPEGYLGFGSIQSFVEEWATRLNSAHHAASVGIDPLGLFNDADHYYDVKRRVQVARLVQAHGDKFLVSRTSFIDETANVWRDDEFGIAIFYHIILTSIFRYFTPLACSQTGTLMPVDNYAFLHMDRLDWVYISWPLEENPYLQRYFELYRAGKFDGSSVSDRYCFFDQALGVLRLKNNSIAQFHIASHFGDEFLSRR